MSHKILHIPSRYGPSAKHYLIFFISGNPGFIAYYSTFLATLNDLLSPNPEDSDILSPVFHIFGQSLPGFEDEDELPSDMNTERSTPYGLQEEIDLTFDLLKSQKISIGDRQGDSFDEIILIGHSVGSYILLELFRKAREASVSKSLKVGAGILLFPTVTNIAQSPNGIIFSAFFRIPAFPKIFSSFVKNLFWPLPETALRWLVAAVTGMPEDAANVTANIFIGKMSLWQALHLARDELSMITEDSWDEDIWGVEHQDPDTERAIPKLVFYFGQKDHWVADHTRNALIATRGGCGAQNSRKPKMLVDQDGIPHAFCIEHSGLVAEKVKVWIDEIMYSD